MRVAALKPSTHRAAFVWQNYISDQCLMCEVIQYNVWSFIADLIQGGCNRGDDLRS